MRPDSSRPLEHIDELTISTSLDPLFSLRGLANYSSLSVSTLRNYLRDPDRPIPHFQLKGKILVRLSEFDAWLEHHRKGVDVDKIVESVLQDIHRTSPSRSR